MIVALDLFLDESVDAFVVGNRDVFFVLFQGKGFWNVVLKGHQLGFVEFVHDLLLVVTLLCLTNLLYRPLDDELVLVDSLHEVSGKIGRCFDCGALVEPEYLWHIFQRERVSDVVFHVFDC